MISNNGYNIFWSNLLRVVLLGCVGGCEGGSGLFLLLLHGSPFRHHLLGDTADLLPGAFLDNPQKISVTRENTGYKLRIGRPLALSTPFGVPAFLLLFFEGMSQKGSLPTTGLRGGGWNLNQPPPLLPQRRTTGRAPLLSRGHRAVLSEGRPLCRPLRRTHRRRRGTPEGNHPCFWCVKKKSGYSSNGSSNGAGA